MDDEFDGVLLVMVEGPNAGYETRVGFGDCVVGRGPLLKVSKTKRLEILEIYALLCLKIKDKRVSRNHVLLRVEKNRVQLWLVSVLLQFTNSESVIMHSSIQHYDVCRRTETLVSIS